MAITIPKKLKPYLPFILAIVAGCIYPLAFAPYDYTILAFTSAIILIYALHNQKPLKNFWVGWLYGLGVFGMGAAWVYVSIYVYGNTPQWLAILLTSLFVSLLALFFGFFALVLTLLFPKTNTTRCLLGFPVLWVLFELLRGWIFTGFPWLYAGYSQFGTHLRAFAPIGSVWAVSWAVMLTAGLLFYIIYYYQERMTSTRLRNVILISFLALWVGAFFTHRINWTQPDGRSLTVALLQGNIPQNQKWDNAHLVAIADLYKQMTLQNLDKQLIVWPEAAMPLPLPYSQEYFNLLSTTIKENHIALIASAPAELVDPNTQTKSYSNLIFGIGAAGGVYHKQHLVPFGEYIPFDRYLRGIIAFLDLPMSSFTAIPNAAPHLLAYDWRIAPAICYEIAYPTLVRSAALNADLLLTVSNDTWFGESIGPYQHLQIAQMRALETGRYLVRATNTGFTAIINVQGEIDAIAPQFEQTTLTGTVYSYNGQTPWVRFGIFPLLIALGLVLLIAVYLERKPKKK